MEYFPIFWLLICVFNISQGFVFFPRGASCGYITAVVMPLNLPNRDVYVAFNFESNYGLPSNDSVNEWINRWDLAENYLGFGNNVTAINGRKRTRRQQQYTRSAFYRSFLGYLDYFQMNGTACLLRTVCEVSESTLDETNGLLGAILKILFTPRTSAPEMDSENLLDGIYEAELQGNYGNCNSYSYWCPHGVLDMISTML